MSTDSSKLMNLLYETLAAEIAAIAQLEDNAIKCEHFGFVRLSKKFKSFAITKVRHYEAVARRILYLGAKLEYRKHALPFESDDITEMINFNITNSVAAINRLNEGINLAIEIKDAGSRMVLEEILRDEERLYDELAKMLEQISRFGEQYFMDRE